ncbi:DUF72 domain-containing protein [Chitiniphilus purpureus]|uniref:DUF72 domain-containing protein n=1 Tax=Chitiniphilus purpureus TaxID=2981137 RepID=A0ABY6DKW9_9NEIS|nr:DUF72 domain-containing protein [Chitiniphilus sp. CD1]UXY13761.1 DUF72 domain-containing protein [Chitiniphilus sp. CD1]
MHDTPRLLIGTAGWSLPAAHRDCFAPGPSQLARYGSVFDAVEINSSFYRPHLADTYRRWAQSVPASFRFSVKLARSITHEARLHQPEALLDAFLPPVSALGDRLGCLLVQLPPSLRWQAPLAHAFFDALRQRYPGPVALEARHASWFHPEALAQLLPFGIAQVAADPAPVPAAAQPGPVAQPVYYRWHGSPQMYYSDYADAALRQLASAATAACEQGRTVWCIFDNTAAGAATGNALQLQRIAGVTV